MFTNHVVSIHNFLASFKLGKFDSILISRYVLFYIENLSIKICFVLQMFSITAHNLELKPIICGYLLTFPMWIQIWNCFEVNFSIMNVQVTLFN